MGCEGNMPSFKYVTVANLVITYSGVPYPIKIFSTNKKYIIWNIDRPYQLDDSNVRPESSLLEYLIVINDNGKPTIVEHDELTYSFDQKTNGSNLTTSGDYNALKSQVSENTTKFNLMSNTVDGMTQIIGSTEELKDGSIIYNLNKVKADSKSYGISIGEIKTKVDDKYAEIKPIILNDLVEYLRSVSEYKLSFTNILEDTAITSDESTLIATNKTNMINKSTKLQSTLSDLKAIIDSVNDTEKSKLIVDAKSKLTTLHNNLISVCTSTLLDNKISGEEKTNIIQKSYELVTYIGTVQNTCNNITVNGQAGVVYSIENELLMLKDSTTSSIKELDRSNDSLNEKYSSVKQTADSLVGEVGGLKTTVGSMTTSSKKNVKSVVTYYTLSSSNEELVGYDFVNIKKGDLIFYGNKENGKYKGTYHVSIFYGTYNGENYVIECSSAADVKKHTDGKTCALSLKKWVDVKKSEIVCVARPNSSSTNRVFIGANDLVTLAKAYYDKRDQYFTYSQINLWTDNSTKTWGETTIAGTDSPDKLYRHLDSSGYLNLLMRGIPFNEVFLSETVFNSKNLAKRTTYSWTVELPINVEEQCQQVESLGWALSGTELHSNNQWFLSVPENPNNFYIWSKNVTTYEDGTTKESELTCLSNSLPTNGKGIVNIIPYYYESTSATETIGGTWTTTSPSWSADKFVWTKNLILYNDDTNEWTTTTCVGGTSPPNLTLNASTYVVSFDSFNALKTTDTIKLTAIQTNFTDTINWVTNPNTVTLSGTGNTRTISPTVFTNLNQLTVTIQSRSMTSTVMIVKVKDGAKGQDGTSVKILGEYATLDALNKAHPSGNAIGDGYVIGLNLYIWNGSEFQDVGQFKGDKGDSGSSSYLHVKYSNDGGNTFTPNNGEDIGLYIGTCVDNKATDPSTVSSYKWVKFKGDKGDTGTGVESMAVEYSKNTSTTTAPTSGWSTTIPPYTKGYYLWYRVRTKYTNNTSYTYSTPVCDTTWKSVSDILNLIGDWSSSETIAESYSKVTQKLDSITQEVKRNTRISQFRYIRDYLNGNTVNTGSHWIEIQVYKDDVNIAKGKTVTCSGTGTNLTRIVDGDTSASNYAEVNGTVTTTDDLNGFKYVQVDLGAVYTNIQKIKVWHYYGDARSYYHKLEVSKDGTNWYRVFDSEKNGQYFELSKGKTYIIDDTYSETQFEQTSDKLSWVVKSGTSSSSMTLTDKMYELISKNITLTADRINLNGYVSNASSNWSINNEGDMNVSNLDVDGYLSTQELRAGNIECSKLPSKVQSSASIYVDNSVSNDSADFENGARYNTLQGAIDAIPTFLNSCDVSIFLNKSVREDIEVRGLSGGACLIYLCSNTIYGSVRVRDNSCRVLIYGGNSNAQPTTLGTIKPNAMISVVSREASVVVQSSTFVSCNFINIYGKTNSSSKEYYYGLICYDGANVYSNGCKIIGCDNGFRSNSLGSIYVASSFGKVNNYVFAAASGSRLTVNNDTQCNSAATTKTYCATSSSLVISSSFSKWDGATTSTGSNDNTTVSTKTVTYKSSYGDTYRSSTFVGYKKDNTVREGNYGYGNCNGAWYFGNQFGDLKGKTITKVTIKITRQDGGTYGAIQHTLKAHNDSSRTSGMPSYIGGYSQSFSVAVGSTTTVTITNSTVLNAISAGTCKGFGLQSAYNKETYSVCSGNATVTITYK